MMISTALQSKFISYRFFAALSAGLSVTLLFTLVYAMDITNVGAANFDINPIGMCLLAILLFALFIGILSQISVVISLGWQSTMDYLGVKPYDAMNMSKVRMLSYGTPALVGFILMQITPLPSQSFKEQGICAFIVMLLVMMAFVRYCAYKLLFQIPIDYQVEMSKAQQ
jgi:hypothetical protein